MLISKFNRIIRSRLVWTILGGIFALSLVVFIGPNTDGCMPSANTGQNEGTINGKPVSSRDFRIARAFEMQARESATLSDDAQARLRQRVWARIAALHAAESMGVTVSDDEVASVIQQHPAFFNKQKGSFDKDLYARIILDQRQTDVETFETSLRQDMILQKMHQVLQSAVWSPASEVTTRINNVTDALTVQGVILGRNRLAPPPEVATDDARRLFDERPEMFRIPDKRAVRYVKFPINDAEQPVPNTDDILAFYDANAADKYTTSGTNGSVTIPLEQVRGEIASNLQHRAAIVATRDKARDFALELQPTGLRKTTATFEALAGEKGMLVHTSRLFSAKDPLLEFKAGMEFAKRTFQLDLESRDQEVSDAILGEEDVYVLALHTNIESRLPAFTEVVERASALARDRMQSEMFRNKCAEVKNAVSKAVAAGKTLEDAVAPFHLAVTNYPVFSLYSLVEEDRSIERSDAVNEVVMTLQKNGVSDVIPMENDALLIFMKDRQPGNLGDAEMLRPEFTARINKYRANLVFSDWKEYLLKVGALDDQVVKAQNRAKEPSKE